MAKRNKAPWSATAEAPTVGLLFADALAAIETAWSLLDAGYQVVALVRPSDRAPLARSRRIEAAAITAPEDDRKKSFDDLQAAILDHGIEYLMPLDDVAIALLEGHAVSCKVVGPSGNQARFALDKERQIEAAKAAGFAVPRTMVIDDPSELDAVATPVVLKPVDAARLDLDGMARGPVLHCADERELEAARGQLPHGGRYLAQDLVVGQGRGVFGLATDTGIERWSGHRRLRMMNPAGSGSSACLPASVPDDVRASCERLITAVGWRGLFMVELLEDGDGTCWFVELNGRPWGSMALSRASGFEYPAWAVSKIQKPGSPLTGTFPDRSVTVSRHLGRELVHLAFVLRGVRTRSPIPWPRRIPTLFAVLRIQRGTRWYNWRRDEVAVFVADTWKTVSRQVRRARR